MGIIKGKDVVNKSVEIDKLSQELQDAINNIPDTSNCVIRETEEDQRIVQSNSSVFEVECKSEDESEESFVHVGVNEVSIRSSIGYFSADVDAIDLIAEQGDIQFFTRSDEGVMKYNDVEIATVDDIPDVSNFIVNGVNEGAVNISSDSKITINASDNAEVVLGSRNGSVYCGSTNGTTFINGNQGVSVTTNDGKLTYNGKEVATKTDIPTTTSSLINDSGFINSDDLSGYMIKESADDQHIIQSDASVFKIESRSEDESDESIVSVGVDFIAIDSSAGEARIDVQEIELIAERGDISFNTHAEEGVVKYNGVEIATVDDIPNMTDFVVNGTNNNAVTINTNNNQLTLSSGGLLTLTNPFYGHYVEMSFMGLTMSFNSDTHSNAMLFSNTDSTSVIHAISGNLSLQSNSGNVELFASKGIAIYKGNEIATVDDIPDTSGFVPVATYNALLSRVEALEAKLAGVNGFWVGTEAEYDAVTTKDSGTYYHIYEE